MNKKENVENISSNTLAHELVAREEQNVGIFFAAFAIQYYLTKEMLHYNLHKPGFLVFVGDIELYASQRVFIKNIILNTKYQHLISKMEFILLEHNAHAEKLPHEILLSKFNKAFLIRQIFKQTDQVLPKYSFIDKYLGINIIDLDLDELYISMEDLTIEQQVLVLTRIFSQLTDSFEGKKKSIYSSFIGNIKSIRQELIKKGKTETKEYHNLEKLYNESQVEL